MRTATAATNMSNMLTRNTYVLRDDFRYSPNRRMPQNVLTSGSAWNHQCKSNDHHLNGKHMQITFYDELRVNGASKISWSYQNCLKSLICSTIPCVYVLKLTWTASAAAYPAAW
jgi:hypothetical protein